MNTLTDVQIFNAALRRLGETKGVSAVDGSDISYHGTLAGDIYYATRDEELRAHNWKFSAKRTLLTSAFLNTTASWGNGATTATLSGVTIVNFTANLAVVAASDLQSRTASNCSVTPNPAWIGQNISGTGIPSGTVVQGIDYVAGTIRLSKQATIAGTAVALSLCPVLNGWLVTTGVNSGNFTPAFPPGIAANTFISKVTSTGSTVTITLSVATTAAGSAVSVCLQPLNAIGTWYMYNEPADSLRDTALYVILPNFVYIWPFTVVHENSFPSRREGGYIYTDLDPGSGNVYAAYIAQVTDSSLYDSLFVDALICMLAAKLAMPVTQGKTLKDDFIAEYSGRIARAQQYNLAEMEMEPPGDPFWTDRERP